MAKKAKSNTVVKEKKLSPLEEEMQRYLDESGHLPRKISPGEIIEGTVVDIRPGVILVDVGYKSEGIIENGK